VLPNQEFFRGLYHDKAPFEATLYALMAEYAETFKSSQFKLTTPKTVDFEQMSTPPWQLVLFDTIIKLTGAKTVLEIGTFVGHTAMQFARMVGANGHVTTIELGQEFADIAQKNFKQNGFEKQITLLQGDAGTFLDSLPANSFDLVFVDGSKQDYLPYTLQAEKLLTARGTIIVDDVFFHGDALNKVPSTDKGRGCKDVLDYFKTNDRFGKLLLPLANGILILFRK
jgi:predicted O-methyltransferase YrrM